MTDVQLRAIIASSNEKQCKDLVNQMQQFGVSTEVVSTAAEAVAAFAEDHHPLVFLACQLDDGSGFDAVQEIQEQQGGEDCVITALSSTKGRNLPAEIDQSLEAGMDFHLEYPFEKEALDEVMTLFKISAWAKQHSPPPAYVHTSRVNKETSAFGRCGSHGRLCHSKLH